MCEMVRLETTTEEELDKMVNTFDKEMGTEITAAFCTWRSMKTPFEFNNDFTQPVTPEERQEFMNYLWEMYKGTLVFANMKLAFQIFAEKNGATTAASAIRECFSHVESFVCDENNTFDLEMLKKYITDIDQE